MSLESLYPPNEHLPAAKVWARYGVRAITLERWLKNTQLCFPEPIRINGRRYWRLGDLQAFEARQASSVGGGKSPLPIMSDD